MTERRYDGYTAAEIVELVNMLRVKIREDQRVENITEAQAILDNCCSLLDALRYANALPMFVDDPEKRDSIANQRDQVVERLLSPVPPGDARFLAAASYESGWDDALLSVAKILSND